MVELLVTCYKSARLPIDLCYLDFFALLLVIISIVSKVLWNRFLHFLMGLIVCASVLKIKMAMGFSSSHMAF